jgi:hypothetical protein
MVSPHSVPCLSSIITEAWHSKPRETCRTDIVYDDKRKQHAVTGLYCDYPVATPTWTIYRSDPPKIGKDGKSGAPGQSNGNTIFVAVVAVAFALGFAIMI